MEVGVSQRIYPHAYYEYDNHQSEENSIAVDFDEDFQVLLQGYYVKKDSQDQACVRVRKLLKVWLKVHLKVAWKESYYDRVKHLGNDLEVNHQRNCYDNDSAQDTRVPTYVAKVSEQSVCEVIVVLAKVDDNIASVVTH